MYLAAEGETDRGYNPCLLRIPAIDTTPLFNLNGNNPPQRHKGREEIQILSLKNNLTKWVRGNGFITYSIPFAFFAALRFRFFFKV